MRTIAKSLATVIGSEVGMWFKLSQSEFFPWDSKPLLLVGPIRVYGPRRLPIGEADKNWANTWARAVMGASAGPDKVSLQLANCMPALPYHIIQLTPAVQIHFSWLSAPHHWRTCDGFMPPQNTHPWSSILQDHFLGSQKWQPTPVFLPGRFHETEEPVRLQSMGPQRVRHDLGTKLPASSEGNW